MQEWGDADFRCERALELESCDFPEVFVRFWRLSPIFLYPFLAIQGVAGGFVFECKESLLPSSSRSRI